MFAIAPWSRMGSVALGATALEPLDLIRRKARVDTPRIELDRRNLLIARTSFPKRADLAQSCTDRHTSVAPEANRRAVPSNTADSCSILTGLATTICSSNEPGPYHGIVPSSKYRSSAVGGVEPV